MRALLIVLSSIMLIAVTPTARATLIVVVPTGKGLVIASDSRVRWPATTRTPARNDDAAQKVFPVPGGKQVYFASGTYGWYTQADGTEISELFDLRVRVRDYLRSRAKQPVDRHLGEGLKEFLASELRRLAARNPAQWQAVTRTPSFTQHAVATFDATAQVSSMVVLRTAVVADGTEVPAEAAGFRSEPLSPNVRLYYQIVPYRWNRDHEPYLTMLEDKKSGSDKVVYGPGRKAIARYLDEWGSRASVGEVSLKQGVVLACAIVSEAIRMAAAAPEPQSIGGTVHVICLVDREDRFVLEVSVDGTAISGEGNLPPDRERSPGVRHEKPGLADASPG